MKLKNKIRKWTLGLIVISLIGLFAVLIINVYMKVTVTNKIISMEEAVSLEADCIVVLGAGVWSSGRPSHMLEDRLVQGIALYEKNVSDRLLMSGDHGTKEYDEVNVMKQFAIDRGIASEHIFMDHAGFSTYESLYRARDVFKVKKIVLVTQRYHLYRGLYVARHLGLEAYGVASDPREYAGQNFREMREILARVKDFFNVLIQPEPSYLGEVIPITGSGDVTND